MDKKVTFNLEKNKIYQTYSSIEYDRHQIDSTLYLFSLKRISQNEWFDMMHELNKYKTNEMQVHIDSIHNTKI